MLTADGFRLQIDAFLLDSGMTPTAFSKVATGDPNFVREVRNGRMPNLALVERVLRYIDTNSGKSVTSAAPQESAGAA